MRPSAAVWNPKCYAEPFYWRSTSTAAAEIGVVGIQRRGGIIEPDNVVESDFLARFQL